MESAPQLSLKWTHFKENFTAQFECLKQEEEFVDVTLSCQGKRLRAHKVILSAASPYLTALFKENPCKHPVLIFDDFPCQHLESLLSFIYTGAVSVPESDLCAFLESANALQIRGLSGDAPATPKPAKRPSVDAPDAITARKRPKPDVRPEFVPKTEPIDPAPAVLPAYDVADVVPAVLPGFDATDGRKQHSLDPRRCPICHRLYSNLSNLRQHLRLIHNPTIVTCKICSKPFKTDLYLRRHLSSYHGENLAPEPIVPPLFRELNADLV